MNDELEKVKLSEFLKSFNKDIEIIWTQNPSIGHIKIGVITKKGISKLSAMNLILNKLNISKENVLGVGDGISDWEFMSSCGYVAAMGNATNELKNLVLGKNNHFIGPHVDNNGQVDIFRHFGLI